jgi:hypothetical protein
MDGCLEQPAQRTSSVAGVGDRRWPWAGYDRAYRQLVMGVAEPRGAGAGERVMAAYGTASLLPGAVREGATRVRGFLIGGKQEAKKPLDVLDGLLYPGHAGERGGPCASPVPCGRW